MKNNIDELDLATANVLSNNAIFNLLETNYGYYDTEVIFFDDTSLIISKKQNITHDGDFIFLIGDDNTNMNIYSKGFNVNNVYEIKTLK